MRSLTFVLPAFNEAPNIEESVRRCVQVGEGLGLRFEVIVVDDGSHDATRALVDGVAAADRRVRCLHHPRNRGYGAALRSGLLAAAMDRVFFTDADLQFDLGQVADLLEHADHYGIVAGWRSPRRDPVGRVLLGACWSRLVGHLFDLQVRDIDCAFKVIDRKVLERIHIGSVGALVNTEILVRARAEGFAILQVPVAHFPRAAGRQTGASPRVVLKALRDLARLHGELRSLSVQARPYSSSSRA